MLLPGQQSNLNVIARIFDMLNQGYMQYLDAEVQALVSNVCLYQYSVLDMLIQGYTLSY